MSLDLFASTHPTSDSSESPQKGIFWDQGLSDTPRPDETTAFLEETMDESLSKESLCYTVAERALTFWLDLKRKLNSRAPEPTIGVDESGKILLSWNLGDTFLECEFKRSVSEVFYEHLEDSTREFKKLPQTNASEANWIAKRIEANL